MFDAGQVFQTHYSKIFSEVRLSNYSKDQEVFDGILSKIKGMFCQQNALKVRRSVTAATAHKTALAQFETTWQRVYSNVFCLSCLGREAQNTLSCGHSFCEPCTMIHGSTPPTECWTFSPSRCPLCKEPNGVAFRMKPYTAGVRCLCVDGGTPQDILVLKALESELKLPAPVTEYFDIAVGS